MPRPYEHRVAKTYTISKMNFEWLSERAYRQRLKLSRCLNELISEVRRDDVQPDNYMQLFCSPCNEYTKVRKEKNTFCCDVCEEDCTDKVKYLI
ncbi:MAG TPA: hypothetical protein DG048_08580 [Pseudoalteromonas sp.]|nr:hypothetical protein [Pseudoalteromonas sp.]